MIKKYWENQIMELFDDEKYEEIVILTNPYKKNIILDFEILYYLKSKLALDNFKIKDSLEVKKILFYYFYLVWNVKFENNYSFSFNKKLLKLNFNNLEKEIKWLNNFKQYFSLWRNEIFLNKVTNTNTIIDFFIKFTYECSELYAFSGEDLPLFKWLINELID